VCRPDLAANCLNTSAGADAMHDLDNLPSPALPSMDPGASVATFSTARLQRRPWTRVIPMTSTVEHALRRMQTVRDGFVVRSFDGSAKKERWRDLPRDRADLPARGATRPLLHTLRHSLRNPCRDVRREPWRLQAWLGHKRIDETMLYVHVAEKSRRQS
jgi:hypothetical protein